MEITLGTLSTDSHNIYEYGAGCSITACTDVARLRAAHVELQLLHSIAQAMRRNGVFTFLNSKTSHEEVPDPRPDPADDATGGTPADYCACTPQQHATSTVWFVLLLLLLLLLSLYIGGIDLDLENVN